MNTHEVIRDLSNELSKASTLVEMDWMFEWDREKVQSILEDVQQTINEIIKEMDKPLLDNK